MNNNYSYDMSSMSKSRKTRYDDSATTVHPTDRTPVRSTVSGAGTPGGTFILNNSAVYGGQTISMQEVDVPEGARRDPNPLGQSVAETIKDYRDMKQAHNESIRRVEGVNQEIATWATTHHHQPWSSSRQQLIAPIPAIPPTSIMGYESMPQYNSSYSSNDQYNSIGYSPIGRNSYNSSTIKAPQSLVSQLQFENAQLRRLLKDQIKRNNQLLRQIHTLSRMSSNTTSTISAVQEAHLREENYRLKQELDKLKQQKTKNSSHNTTINTHPSINGRQTHQMLTTTLNYQVAPVAPQSNGQQIARHIDQLRQQGELLRQQTARLLMEKKSHHNILNQKFK